MKWNRINEPYSNEMQGEEHATHLATGEGPMATSEHPLARNHNTGMQKHHPTPGMTKTKQSATTAENDAPSPNSTFQTLLPESAYLIQVLCCKRVIQEKYLPDEEIRARWYRANNNRLTINKVTVTNIMRTKKLTKLVEDTWEPAIGKEGKPQHTGCTVVRF